MQSKLEIKELLASVDGKEVLKGIDLVVNTGEVHALMGPNGAGKSTLANVLMGNPKYKASGSVLLNGVELMDKKVNERAKQGLFLAFQYPREVSGVTIANFLRTAYNSIHPKLSILEFKALLKEKMQLLKMDESFANRYLNEGFSGGEKKRAEILQLAVLQPKFALLDETDSGLDVDALRIVSEGINALKKDTGILLITHYNRILSYVKPDFVHVLSNGRIVKSGGAELAKELESSGYEELTTTYA